MGGHFPKILIVLFTYSLLVQGFAKEEDESEVFAVRKEVRINKESRKRKQKTQDEVASDKFSLWTNFEAYNELYICWIEDFFCILDQLRLRVDKELFKSIAMKIWFKYLKESEAAFSREDHLNIVKLHPLANQRDRLQVNQSEELQSEKLPYFKMNYLNTKKRFLVLKYSNIQKFKESDDFEQLHKNFLNIFNETQANKAPYQAKKGLDSVYFELSKQSFNRPDVFADLVNEMIKGNDVTETVAQLRMEREIEKMNQLADSQNSEANPSTNPIDLIPYKSKKLLDLTSEEALNNSPYYSCTRVDHITKGKLLACLYLTIRVYNINIFPSDLIRWAFEGLIRYHNPLGCFPEHWELRISDTKKYCCYKCIDYPNFQTMIKNLLVHCGLDMTLFSSPDCYEFIRRLIKDLNLPKGLNLIVKQRYGDYIERQQIDAAENSLNIPHYEYVGIAVVLLTLRDLFDLFGKNNAHYDKFKNSESITDLFIWSEWFHFSKLCLSLIKIFYFKRRSFLPNTSTIDFDQFLSSHDNFDHQDQLLVKHRRKLLLLLFVFILSPNLSLYFNRQNSQPNGTSEAARVFFAFVF